jgi:hypothetical protein
MSTRNTAVQATHSQAWIMQSWASLVISISATIVGILYLPVNTWIKAYLGMGVTFSLGSTVSISKTIRDQHESDKLAVQMDQVRVEKLLAERNQPKSNSTITP